MATGKLLRQLIKSGIEGNMEAFRVASEEVIKEERQKQHHLRPTIWSGCFMAGPKTSGIRPADR